MMAKKTKKVMIVEDEAEYMEQIAGIVEQTGYIAVRCSNGGSALSVYEKERPDMVITDFMCGGISGAEITNQIRKRKRALPIYIQSSHPISYTLITMSGATGFILKDRLGDQLPKILKKYFGDNP
jgi:CheY-like chemotaxis protein